MINRVVLTGRLTRDVELRYTQSGAAVATFTLAVDQRFTNSSGERGADFISCVIWRKPAETFANYMHKGSLVGLEGRLQTRNYENQQGQRVYVTEVVVDNWSFLEPRSANSNSGNNGNYGNNNGGNTNNNNNYNAPQGDVNPFAGGSNNGGNRGGNSAPSNNNGGNAPADPFANSGDQIDISDDDLPF
ncbi:single-stranded DNA-binding protein [Levilactobacillus bambusae]|uniref:Single-stranded DNA-binding protein n=1 Tax=Levilactobacillus bambusae TaxID=2024736 RepID=A0A2V1N199_9LACO|nr:single-stranded DNA-binding protein [Levilactobacillus bambusae]PWG00518.1 single-stranded DNA-binding protein [Levilactobacillus bambusae]